MRIGEDWGEPFEGKERSDVTEGCGGATEVRKIGGEQIDGDCWEDGASEKL